jgi:hypothetical protein
MSIKIVQISDGFSSSEVPSIVDVQGSRIVNHTVTQTTINNGFFTLPVPANLPSTSMLFWLGVGQIYGLDFQILGDKITILTNLKSKLAANDVLVLYYQ